MIILQCQRDKLPLPDKIANKPEMLFGLEVYYQGFRDLHSCRPIGMAEGSISWLDIDHYCDRLSLDEEQREDMHFLVRGLDDYYLDWRSKNKK